MSHADHLFPDSSTDAEVTEDGTVLMRQPDRLLYIPAALAGHHSFGSAAATVAVDAAGRLPGHPESPFDPSDEIIAVENMSNIGEFLVDAKYIAHYRDCAECRHIWVTRETDYATLLPDEQRTAAFFAITETNQGPYLVHASDLDPRHTAPNA